jgi:hypothetical protein
MIHRTSPDFWQLYNALPHEIRELADRNYALLRDDPSHPSLRFREIEGLWSVRVGAHYRECACARRFRRKLAHLPFRG